MIKNQCPICKGPFEYCGCDHPVALKAKTAFYIEQNEIIRNMTIEEIERMMCEPAFSGETIMKVGWKRGIYK